jgi:hypothetical protein
MNSRRLMASPVPRTTSGFKTISHFWIEKDRYTQTGHPHVRFGSKADMTRCDGDVRFTPESGHRSGGRAKGFESDTDQVTWMSFRIFRTTQSASRHRTCCTDVGSFALRATPLSGF